MESNTWCENLLLWFISKDSYQYPCLEYCAGLFKKDEVKLKVLDYYLSYCWYHTLGGKKKDWKYSSLVIKKKIKKYWMNLFHVTGQLEKAVLCFVLFLCPVFKFHELTLSVTGQYYFDLSFVVILIWGADWRMAAHHLKLGGQKVWRAAWGVTFIWGSDLPSHLKLVLTCAVFWQWVRWNNSFVSACTQWKSWSLGYS